MDDGAPRDGDQTQSEAARPEDSRPVAKKPYKSPVISRHGNLRLMTQLE